MNRWNAIRQSLYHLLAMMAFVASASAAQHPPINQKPRIDAPAQLLWPADRAAVAPSLDDPTSNLLYDFHGEIASCDFLFSSEGNYHPALHDIWPVFLAKFKDDPLRNAFYSTSPPVFGPQIENGVLQFTNLYVSCRPQVAAASMQQIRKLQAAGQTEGEPIAFYRDRGEVILVKKGNPKGIRTVWDLGRDDVVFVSPNPELEPGAFGNYAESIFGIAANDPAPPAGLNARGLFDAVFNTARPGKWVAGPRIHHRDLPWSIAHGRADAGVILYHLARYIKETFPDQFDIVPLGGTVDKPEPLPGSVLTERYLVRVKGDWNERQRRATETWIETLLSDEFTAILRKRGIDRPEGFRSK